MNLHIWGWHNSIRQTETWDFFEIETLVEELASFPLDIACYWFKFQFISKTIQSSAVAAVEPTVLQEKTEPGRLPWRAARKSPEKYSLNWDKSSYK